MNKENNAGLKDEKLANEMDEKIKEEKVNKILKKAKENGKITYG